MSITQLYRQGIALSLQFETYSYGNPVKKATPVVWYKGNVQPYKMGNTIGINDNESFLSIQKYRSVYLSGFDYDDIDYSSIPEGASPSIRENALIFLYFNNNWHQVLTFADYRNSGRGVKHVKFTVVGGYGLTPRYPDESFIGNPPTPILDLVDRFNNEVNELQQMTNIIEN